MLASIIAKVMGVPASNINDSSGPETIKSWDSFNSLVLLDEIESSYKVKFTLEEIHDCKTVADIRRHLRARGIEA